MSLTTAFNDARKHLPAIGETCVTKCIGSKGVIRAKLACVDERIGRHPLFYVWVHYKDSAVRVYGVTHWRYL